jgi:hypothetical protein
MTMMPVFARDALHVTPAATAPLSSVGPARRTGVFMAGMAGGPRPARARPSVLFGLVLTASALAPTFWWAIVLSRCPAAPALNGIAANTMPGGLYLRGRVMVLVRGAWHGAAWLARAGWSPSTTGPHRGGSGGLVCLVVAWAVVWG